VAVSPQTIQVPVSNQQQFNAAVSGAQNTTVTWSVNGVTGGDSTVGIVSSSGLYTAPAAVPNRPTVTLDATSQANTAVTGAALVTITAQRNNPVPTINALLPASLAVGTTPQTLTINGAGFITTSTVTFNGVAHTPTYVSASQLTISLTSSDLATAGSYPVAVINPAPGGGSSVAVDFTVLSTNPVPAITSVAPASLTVGAPPQTLTINGTGFLTASTVSVNGVAHTPTYVSASQLTISLTAADLATAGTYVVIVTNPTPGGGASLASYFTVINPQTANEWTWISGSSTVGALGIYGTFGVPSASNVPGSRDAASSWIDSSGDFWLFGGYGYASTGPLDSLNDLWMFNPVSGNWTWASGSDTISAVAVYGSQGVPATTNVPGARMYAVSWIDKNDKLWLFGGEGVGSNNVSGFLDDLWEFDPIAKTWAWVSGNSATGTSGIYGNQGIASTGNVPGSRYRAVSWIDSSGDFWLFGGDGVDSTGFPGQLNDLWEFIPSANTWTWISGSSTANVLGVYGTQGIPATTNVPGSRRQAVSWIDSSNNLWLFGGSGWNASGSAGGAPLNDLWEFNPTAKTWTWVSGSSTTYTANGTISAVGVYGTQGIAGQGNTPGGRTNPVSWIDSSANLWLFGGNGYDSTATVGELSDLWEFNPSTSEWTWVSGSNTANAIGTYGAQNVSAATNVPGSREYSVSWIDNNGNLWLFGGDGYGSAGSFNLLNDLWRYQPLNLTAPSIIGR
jgi:N-acetylneuraminic acid mutarotase